MANGLAGSLDQFRRIVAPVLHVRFSDCTLTGPALVHEAWLRLGGDEKRQWKDRTHFFATTAAAATRRILADNARRKRAPRHGGGRRRVEMLKTPVCGNRLNNRFRWSQKR